MTLTSILLKRDGAIAANVGTRVYPITAPQDAKFPYLILDLVDESGIYVLAGPARWYDVRLSVSSLAERAVDADAIGELIRGALEAARGEIADSNSPPVRLGEAEYQYISSMFDHSDDRSVHRRVLDFAVKWRH